MFVESSRNMLAIVICIALNLAPVKPSDGGDSDLLFTFESNLPISSKSEFWIDKQTGACLKYISDLQNEAGYVRNTFNCTEFTLSGVTLPSVPES